jgi:hypothetical protein
MHTTCPSLLILLDFITRIMSGEEYPRNLQFQYSCLQDLCLQSSVNQAPPVVAYFTFHWGIPLYIFSQTSDNKCVDNTFGHFIAELLSILVVLFYLSVCSVITCKRTTGKRVWRFDNVTVLQITLCVVIVILPQCDAPKDFILTEGYLTDGSGYVDHVLL